MSQEPESPFGDVQAAIKWAQSPDTHEKLLDALGRAANIAAQITEESVIPTLRLDEPFTH